MTTVPPIIANVPAPIEISAINRMIRGGNAPPHAGAAQARP